MNCIRNQVLCPPAAAAGRTRRETNCWAAFHFLGSFHCISRILFCYVLRSVKSGVTKKVPNISSLLISNKHLHAEWSSFEKKEILLRPRVRLITQGVPSRDLRISRRNNLITRLVFLVAHSAPSGEMVEEGEPFIRSPEAAREQSSPVR